MRALREKFVAGVVLPERWTVQQTAARTLWGPDSDRLLSPRIFTPLQATLLYALVVAAFRIPYAVARSVPSGGTMT